MSRCCAIVTACALLAAAPEARAHGSRFSISAISIAPDDPDTWWANANGWGVVRTSDAGNTWTWRCEEGIGTASVYDLLALDHGEAVLATVDGLLRIGPGCGSEALPGLPEGAQVTVLSRGSTSFYAAIYVDGAGGLYQCVADVSGDTSGCIATDLQGPYVKSVQVVVGDDGADHVYATTVDVDTLAASLHVSDDGASFHAVHAWPDGDVDPHVLYAGPGEHGDRVLVWRVPRSIAAEPTLSFSDDGGVTFADVLSDGQYTDPVPGIAVAGQTVWLGSDVGRTWRSLDGGRHFFEVSAVEPAVRCSDRSGGRLVVCADHFADGFDVAVWEGAQRWAGAGCLDSAAVDSCGEETCEVYHDAFLTAGAYGGGACFAEPVDDRGCSGGSEALVAPWILLLGLRATRRSRAP